MIKSQFIFKNSILKKIVDKISFTHIMLFALIGGYAVGKYTSIDFANTYELMLYLMIFLIGVDLAKSDGLKSIKHVGKMGLILPAISILGAVIAALIATPLFGIPIKYSLAISTSVGWYSLAGPTIATYSTEYGLIAFLMNFMREIFTMIGYPLAVKKFPKDSAITLGGATSMDSTMPVVAKFGGTEYTMLSFVHGVILSALVPFILPLILML
ncbi:lysine exporter LysO family protein [Methanococcus voltae]|uniref:Lysine exporter LysO family protein n=1 Tax=Methanococcus voltae (strain ATCC BAA-1334 / A3) TaxID=456320 RepID=D7DRG1_METV3|nr:lysine exporter LysO family protein [Methanococcus voltae]MCS3901098.1 uncharacterized membrane protein YbjE (DUF340 family) [Methanococcus voltae]